MFVAPACSSNPLALAARPADGSKSVQVTKLSNQCATQPAGRSLLASQNPSSLHPGYRDTLNSSACARQGWLVTNLVLCSAIALGGVQKAEISPHRERASGSSSPETQHHRCLWWPHWRLTSKPSTRPSVRRRVADTAKAARCRLCFSCLDREMLRKDQLLGNNDRAT